MPRSERMPPADAAWLHMETPENRMMITAVLQLERPLSQDALAAVLRERLVGRYPRFRQKIVHGALGEARWTDDEAFDLRVHLHRIGVPSPGGREGLQVLVGQLLSTPLDHDRPLWQIHVVDGVGEGNAVIARLHHAIADGISLARVLLSLTDGGEPDAPLVEEGDEDGHDTTRRGRWGAVIRGSGERLLDRGWKALTNPVEAVEHTGDQLAGVARLGGTSAAVTRKLLTLSDDPHTALRGPLGLVKGCAWSDGIALDRVRDLGKALGGTVNDVLLTALAATLGRYLRDQGDEVDELRTLVPVNLRPADRPIPPELGNHFGLVFLALPVDHQPPRQRFYEVKRRMDALKQSTEPAVTHALLSAVGLSPTQVERLVVDVFGAKASLITTNVPGPRERLTLAGVPVERILFWVPQSGAVALGVSLFSYAGRVFWGVSADLRRVPDPEAIVRGFEEAIQELERAVRTEQDE